MPLFWMSVFKSSDRAARLSNPSPSTPRENALGLGPVHAQRGRLSRLSRAKIWLVMMMLALTCCSEPDSGVRYPAACCACSCAPANNALDVSVADIALDGLTGDCAAAAPGAEILVEDTSGPGWLKIVPIEESDCKRFKDIIGKWYFTVDVELVSLPPHGTLTPVSTVEFSINSCDPLHILATESEYSEPSTVPFWRWPHMSMLDLASGHYDYVQLNKGPGGAGCVIELARERDGVFETTSALGYLRRRSAFVNGQDVEDPDIIDIGFHSNQASLVRIKPGN